MAYYSGDSGTVTIPGISTLACKQWTANHEIELVDVSNKTSGGFHESITGLQKLTGSADCVYNGHKVVVGTSGAFTFNFPDTSTITGTCWVEKVGYESDTTGAVMVKIDFTATGSFTVGS